MAAAPVIAARSTSRPPVERGLRWIAPTVPLEAVAARNEDALALADRAGRLTYAQVRSAARRLAAELIAGTPAESAVAVLLPNNAMCLVATLACFAAGRVCVLLNAEHPAERNHAILRRAGVSAVIVDDPEVAPLIPANAIRIPVARASDGPPASARTSRGSYVSAQPARRHSVSFPSTTAIGRSGSSAVSTLGR